MIQDYLRKNLVEDIEANNPEKKIFLEDIWIYNRLFLGKKI